jgi:hypothetical protein
MALHLQFPRLLQLVLQNLKQLQPACSREALLKLLKDLDKQSQNNSALKWLQMANLQILQSPSSLCSTSLVLPLLMLQLSTTMQMPTWTNSRPMQKQLRTLQERANGLGQAKPQALHLAENEATLGRQSLEWELFQLELRKEKRRRL